jgi:phosphohistidine phosphatase
LRIRHADGVKIYLIRHGHAVDAELHLADGERYLSKKGRRTTREVGRALRKASVSVDAILTSPLVRAVQTAELVAEQLGFEGVIEVLPSLMPIGPIETSAEAIREQSRSVAVVGHEPSISALAGLLTGQGHFPPLRKAQVVCVHGDRAVWTIDPDRLDPVSL